MKNPDNWKPTKYEATDGHWRPSRDRAELVPASMVSATLSLNAYKLAIQQYANGHLADFGCGKVPFYGLYRDLVEEVTCVDWPGTFHQSEHIDIVTDLNQHTEIPDASFDTIISSSVLEHIWKHDIFWDEMSRVLKHGGNIILGVPFVYWLHEEPHDYFRWTRHALTRACDERGLKVAHLAPYGGGLDVLVDLLVRSIGAISMTMAGPLGRIAAWILTQGAVRRLTSKHAEKLPLGYILVAQKPVP